MGDLTDFKLEAREILREFHRYVFGKGSFRLQHQEKLEKLIVESLRDAQSETAETCEKTARRGNCSCRYRGLRHHPGCAKYIANKIRHRFEGHNG